MSDPILIKAKRGQRETSRKLEAQGKNKRKTDMRSVKGTDPVAFNDWAEEKFVDLVRELIGPDSNARIKRVQVMQESTYEIGISMETAKRYLFKHTARRAEFRLFDGYVFLNPKYEPRREEDDGE